MLCTSDGTRTHISLIKSQVRKPITDTEVFVGKEGFEPPMFLCHGFTDRLLHQFAYLPNLCTRLESNQRNQIKSLGHLDTRSPLCYECVSTFLLGHWTFKGSKKTLKAGVEGIEPTQPMALVLQTSLTLQR